MEKYEPCFAHGWDYQLPGTGTQVHVEMRYDPRGNLIRTLNPDGTEQRIVYGTPRNPTALTLQDDSVFPDEFDATPWESYTYDPNDLAPVSTDAYEGSLAARAPQEHHWTPRSLLIDALGRTICIIDRNGSSVEHWHVTTSAYDIRNNPTVIFDPFQRPTFTYAYDLLNRPLRVSSIDAGVRTSVFDATGNAAEYRDSKGAVVLYSYDQLNRPLKVWARNDKAQSRVTLRERIEYGDRGIPAAPDDPDRLANLAVNRLGRPAEHWDEAGQVTFDAYDFTGNLTEQTRSVVSDATLAAVPPGQPWIPDWDTLDSGSALDPAKYRSSSRYDALNRLASLTHPADVDGVRRTQYNHYNRAGALESVALDEDIYVQHIAYNAKQQRVLIAYGNDILTRYAYDPITFRLRRVHTQHGITDPSTREKWIGEGPPLQNYTYSYDLAGNITGIDERVPGCGIRANPAAGTRADPALRRLLAAGDALARDFSYDPLYRLTSATGRACQLPRAFQDIPGWGAYQTTQPAPNQDNAPDLTEAYAEAYTYDPAGNMRELAFTAASGRSWKRSFGIGGLDPDSTSTPPNNQLTSLRAGQNTMTYQFNDNGNLIQQNLERHHSWDHADRMIGYTIQAGAEPSLQARYIYGADGTRVKKWIQKGNAATAASSTTYIGGSFEHCTWTDGGATRHNSWLHITNGTSRVALQRTGPTRDPADTSPAIQYQLGDHIDSTTLVVGPAGQWINREEFYPYGETSFGSYISKRYRYTGVEFDEESNLSYHGARYYAPWVMRWVSPDPIPLDAGSQYRYANGNPMNRIDPSGTEDKPAAAPAQPRVDAAAPGSGRQGESWQGYVQGLLARNKFIEREAPRRAELHGHSDLELVATAGTPPAERILESKDMMRLANYVAWTSLTFAGGGGIGAVAPEWLLKGMAVLGAGTTGLGLGEAATGESVTGERLDRLDRATRIMDALLFATVLSLAHQMPVPSSEGRLKVLPGAHPDESELASAKYLRDLGFDVTVRPPGLKRSRAGGTADLLLTESRALGEAKLPIDVYTPKTSDPSRIVSNASQKTDQTRMLIINLSKTSVTRSQLGDLNARVKGTGSKGFDRVVIHK